MLNNGAGAGYYRALDGHEAYDSPLALHIPPTLAAALQWAKVDPAVNKPWRDGPSFNARLGLLAGNGVVQFLGTTFADHILPYYPQSYTSDNLDQAEEFMTGYYGTAPSTSVLYPAERVLDSAALDIVQGSGFGFTIADQMRHYLKWFGRTSALGNDGYRINRVNGVKLMAISDQASGFRFQNTDGGLSVSLRELLSRKSRSAQQDQIVLLHSEWADFTNKAQADAYDVNLRWLASHPWIQLTTPQEIAAGLVDSNANGTGDVWPVVDRGSQVLPLVAKDYIDHATQESYDHWFFGQASREESLFDKVFNIRPGSPLPVPFGRVGQSGLTHTAWNQVAALSSAPPELQSLARSSYHASTYLTAFHNQSNNDLGKFSTGAYINPDTTFQTLSGFSKAAQSQSRASAVQTRVAQWTAAVLSGSVTTAVASQEDVDLDGENELLLYNGRVFAVFERIGGRLTGVWVRDLANGKTFQCIGNPVSYSGFETEEEGAANILAGAVGSYRTSGLKDWFAAGPNSIAYNNDLYTATSAPVGTGWRLTSGDGKIVKTVTLTPLSNSLSVSYNLDPAVTTLFVRHGMSPHLLDLLQRGQTGLVSNGAVSGTVNVATQGTDGTVRNYVRVGGSGFSGSTWNNAAVDDDAGQGVTFDMLNMRNQAQTEQVELAVTSGATFAMGFETGPTLSLDSDGDGLPDAWEQTHTLNPNDPTGVHGASGNTDGDALTNEEEFIVGKNPLVGDVYIPAVDKIAAGYRLTFSTIPDRFYRVVYNDELSGNWLVLADNLLATGSSLTIIDDGSASTPHPNTRPRRFYKVEVKLVNP